MGVVTNGSSSRCWASSKSACACAKHGVGCAQRVARGKPPGSVPGGFPRATLWAQPTPCLAQAHALLLLAQHLDDEPFVTTPIELAVEDGLPGPEVEPAVGDRDDHLVVHQQVLEVGVA